MFHNGSASARFIFAKDGICNPVGYLNRRMCEPLITYRQETYSVTTANEVRNVVMVVSFRFPGPQKAFRRSNLLV